MAEEPAEVFNDNVESDRSLLLNRITPVGTSGKEGVAPVGGPQGPAGLPGPQ